MLHTASEVEQICMLRLAWQRMVGRRQSFHGGCGHILWCLWHLRCNVDRLPSPWTFAGCTTLACPDHEMPGVRQSSEKSPAAASSDPYGRDILTNQQNMLVKQSKECQGECSEDHKYVIEIETSDAEGEAWLPQWEVVVHKELTSRICSSI